MNASKIIAICLFATFGIFTSCYCQNENYDAYFKIINKIESKLETSRKHKYNVSGIDGNQSINDGTMDKGKIKDPYHTLSGRFIFMASGEHAGELRGLVGIYEYKTDLILWCSVDLPDDFSTGALGIIAETDEINNDGKVEIIITQALGALANYEALWIFNWDGKKGNLITQLDERGESELFMMSDPSYNLVDRNGNGVAEIHGLDKDASGNDIDVCYKWNGSIYGKFVKPSRNIKKK